MNNQKIEFTGQTKAPVKTNTESPQLPLLVTKAITSLLMGLEWMQQLGILNSTNDSEIQTPPSLGGNKKENYSVEERIPRPSVVRKKNRKHNSQNKPERRGTWLYS